MSSGDALRHLDKRFKTWPDPETFKRPQRGWLYAIRHALGMTLEQLGQRLGVSKVRIKHLEDAELTGSVTLESLEKAANALNCTLVYALVPKEPLTLMVENRARQKAQDLLRHTQQTMALEDQAPLPDEQNAQLNQLIQKLLSSKRSRLWD